MGAFGLSILLLLILVALFAPVIALGIGNGRTLDHLSVLFPERKVFAFDNVLHSAIGVLPPADQIVMGDIRETLPFALPRLGEEDHGYLVTSLPGDQQDAHQLAYLLALIQKYGPALRELWR